MMNSPLVEVIHVLHHGSPFCDTVEGLPNEWPGTHRWVGLAERHLATCSGCQINSEKYMITQERPPIRRASAKEKLEELAAAIQFLEDRVSVKTCKGSMMDAVRDVQQKFKALRPHITV